MKKLMDRLDLTTFSSSPKILAAFKKELEDIFGFKSKIQTLETQLQSFEKTLEAAFNKNEFLDQELALRLHKKAIALLSICKEDSFAEHVPFSLAAISYFLNSEDASHDFSEFDGFDDDRHVLNHVINQFQLRDKISMHISNQAAKGDA